ncbi:MAG: RNase adapter RapZ [Angustibacter sp.]
MSDDRGVAIDPEATRSARSDDEPDNDTLDLVILTGMSSAGRSTAAKVLEDLGWYVVDNLPPQLLTSLWDLANHGSGRDDGPVRLAGLAAVVDVRSRSFFQALQDGLVELRGRGVYPRVVFLDATDDVLVRRQESVRRPHPLQGHGRILDGIVRERQMLGFLRERADLVIDTSGINVTQLRTKVSEAFDTGATPVLRATVMSFGFKYGLPLDADFVVDVRFLPNPFWVSDLRPLTGRDAAVAEYVLGQDGAAVFLDRFVASMEPVIAGYQAESKRYVTIAVGCTGGKHRSVAMSGALAKRLDALGVSAGVLHRDLGRE